MGLRRFTKYNFNMPNVVGLREAITSKIGCRKRILLLSKDSLVKFYLLKTAIITDCGFFLFFLSNRFYFNGIGTVYSKNEPTIKIMGSFYILVCQQSYYLS
jgi:hypothetical protein